MQKTQGDSPKMVGEFERIYGEHFQIYGRFKKIFRRFHLHIETSENMLSSFKKIQIPKQEQLVRNYTKQSFTKVLQEAVNCR